MSSTSTPADAGESLLRYMRTQQANDDRLFNRAILRYGFALGGGADEDFEPGLAYALGIGWVLEGPDDQLMLTSRGIAYANRFLALAG